VRRGEVQGQVDVVDQHLAEPLAPTCPASMLVRLAYGRPGCPLVRADGSKAAVNRFADSSRSARSSSAERLAPASMSASRFSSDS